MKKHKKPKFKKTKFLAWLENIFIKMHKVLSIHQKRSIDTIADEQPFLAWLRGNLVMPHQPTSIASTSANKTVTTVTSPVVNHSVSDQPPTLTIGNFRNTSNCFRGHWHKPSEIDNCFFADVAGDFLLPLLFTIYILGMLVYCAISLVKCTRKFATRRRRAMNTGRRAARAATGEEPLLLVHEMWNVERGETVRGAKRDDDEKSRKDSDSMGVSYGAISSHDADVSSLSSLEFEPLVA